MSQVAISKPPTRNWRRYFFVAISLWAVTTVSLSFPPIRGIVAYPLYVSDNSPEGDVAYVMADGFAYWERLHAASDLYHQGRVPRIVILEENATSQFSYVRHRSETVSERAIEFLDTLGVPKQKVSTIKTTSTPLFGSWSEALAFADQQPAVNQVVVVTSAPHTRRSRLCFRRALPGDVQIMVYAPTNPAESWEVFDPIWMEYVKLGVYWVAIH